VELADVGGTDQPLTTTRRSRAMADADASPRSSSPQRENPQPDAELLAVYDRWLAAWRAYEVDPDESDAARASYARAITEALEEIDRLPAHGLRGALAKLRVALCEHVGGDPLELHPASRRGEEIDPGTLPDRSARLLLEAIQTLERLAKADAS
jgi:hypothetical protein